MRSDRKKKLQVAHVVLMIKMIKDKAEEKACVQMGGRKTKEERFLRGKKKEKKHNGKIITQVFPFSSYRG